MAQPTAPPNTSLCQKPATPGREAQYQDAALALTLRSLARDLHLGMKRPPPTVETLVDAIAALDALPSAFRDRSLVLRLHATCPHALRLLLTRLARRVRQGMPESVHLLAALLPRLRAALGAPYVRAHLASQLHDEMLGALTAARNITEAFALAAALHGLMPYAAMEDALARHALEACRTPEQWTIPVAMGVSGAALCSLAKRLRRRSDLCAAMPASLPQAPNSGSLAPRAASPSESRESEEARDEPGRPRSLSARGDTVLGDPGPDVSLLPPLSPEHPSAPALEDDNASSPPPRAPPTEAALPPSSAKRKQPSSVAAMRGFPGSYSGLATSGHLSGHLSGSFGGEHHRDPSEAPMPLVPPTASTFASPPATAGNSTATLLRGGSSAAGLRDEGPLVFPLKVPTQHAFASTVIVGAVTLDYVVHGRTFRSINTMHWFLSGLKAAVQQLEATADRTPFGSVAMPFEARPPPPPPIPGRDAPQCDPFGIHLVGQQPEPKDPHRGVQVKDVRALVAGAKGPLSSPVDKEPEIKAPPKGTHPDAATTTQRNSAAAASIAVGCVALNALLQATPEKIDAAGISAVTAHPGVQGRADVPVRDAAAFMALKCAVATAAPTTRGVAAVRWQHPALDEAPLAALHLALYCLQYRADYAALMAENEVSPNAPPMAQVFPGPHQETQRQLVATVAAFARITVASKGKELAGLTLALQCLDIVAHGYHFSSPPAVCCRELVTYEKLLASAHEATGGVLAALIETAQGMIAYGKAHPPPRRNRDASPSPRGASMGRLSGGSPTSSSSRRDRFGPESQAPDRTPPGLVGWVPCAGDRVETYVTSFQVQWALACGQAVLHTTLLAETDGVRTLSTHLEGVNGHSLTPAGVPSPFALRYRPTGSTTTQPRPSMAPTGSLAGVAAVTPPHYYGTVVDDPATTLSGAKGKDFDDADDCEHTAARLVMGTSDAVPGYPPPVSEETVKVLRQDDPAASSTTPSSSS